MVEESSWRVLGGRVTLAGSLGRGDSPAWTVSGRAAGIDPSQLRPELPGKLGFGYSASGNGFAADGPWTARIRDLDGTFRGQPARGSGGISRAPGRLEFEDLALSLGPARLQADGVVGRGANLDARLVSDDLSAILPELGGEVNATVGLRGESLAIGFIGHDLAYGSHRAVVLSVDARIDREGREHSWLRLRSNGITLAGFAIIRHAPLAGRPGAGPCADLPRRRRPGCRVAAGTRRLGRRSLHARAREHHRKRAADRALEAFFGQPADGQQPGRRARTRVPRL